MNKTLARILSAVTLVLAFAGSALAQSGYVLHTAPTAYQSYSDTLFRVCATNDASPCTTTPIYSDAALATVVTQTSGVTLTNDKKAKFYMPPGQYVIQWYSAQGGSGYFAETFQVGSAMPQVIGVYQGTASVGITTGNFTALIAAASDVKIPANYTNVAGRAYHIHGQGVYTTAAASVLNAEVMLCTVSGCGSGTVVAPAGCAVITTNQANVLANGQFTIDCDLIATSTVGASGTFMAKGVVAANLGATTAVALTPFSDTATAVSAAVDETVAEFVNIAFKFTTSNASNAAVLHNLTVTAVK
jgi:hypothetical protein